MDTTPPITSSAAAAIIAIRMAGETVSSPTPGRPGAVGCGGAGVGVGGGGTGVAVGTGGGVGVARTGRPPALTVHETAIWAWRYAAIAPPSPMSPSTMLSPSASKPYIAASRRLIAVLPPGPTNIFARSTSSWAAAERAASRAIMAYISEFAADVLAIAEYIARFDPSSPEPPTADAAAFAIAA